jgi:DNA-binding response OmpR family regulator
MLAKNSSDLPHRLLVAEDDSALREMMVALFKADGHDVVEAANGLDLLDTLEVSLDPETGSGGFDLVISDIRMPELSGLKALARFGHGPNTPPVILITAFGDEEVRREAIHLGVIAVVDKPFDFDELRSFVNGLLAKR